MQRGIVCQIIEKPIKLNFEKYISNICKKASSQLNAIWRLHAQRKEKEAMINTFVHSNVNYYGPAVFVFGTSVLKSPKIKLKSS